MSSMENMCSIQIMYFMLKGSYTGMVEMIWKITSISFCFCAGINTLVFLFFINSVIFNFFFFFEFMTLHVDF